MKKHNLLCHAELVSASILFLLILLAGCKSVPAGGRPVDPLELIDADSSFYMAIPKAADNVLIERVITGFYPEVSASDAKMIADRVNKVYCGLNRTRHGTEVQASVDGAIPQKFLPKVLNAKKGFVISDYTPPESAVSYKVYSGQLEMTFPSDKIACIELSKSKSCELILGNSGRLGILFRPFIRFLILIRESI